MARLLRHRQTKEAETDRPGLTSTAPHSYSTVKTIACGNAGRFRCTRCCSCAFYQYKVHTKPRVQRAPGIPHALHGGERFMHSSGASRREIMKSCLEQEQTPSFRGDAKHRTRNLEIPRCAIAHLRSGPADHPGMTVSGLHVIASEAKQSILALRGTMDCFASLAMTAGASGFLRGACHRARIRTTVGSQ